MNAPRSDSWYAGLTEEQLWEMYSTAKKFGSAWYKTIEWANAKWKLELKTSKTAYYRWKEWMYDQDSGTREHFAALTSRSVEEQAAAARILDRSLTDGIKSLAAQALFVADDPVKGRALAETFSKFATAALEGEKLKLAAAAQSTKDEQLKLAREKFEAAEKRLERVAEIADAARGGKVDPAKVADEIDRILGRKK
ncbi:MAG: hypothetical protein II840_11635 [Kiritimatiellae bacterium]|nr:hypothetical protein [Kiritimatiellia bacterium]